MNDPHESVALEREGVVIDGRKRAVLGHAKRLDERACPVERAPDEPAREVLHERMTAEVPLELVERPSTGPRHRTLEATDLRVGEGLRLRLERLPCGLRALHELHVVGARGARKRAEWLA